MLNPLYSCNISAKIQKNIQKVDYMDGFCWQGELDLTLFYLFYPMQLVTPSVVAIAVSMLMAICRIVFQVFAFIFFEC
mgnify:FL=1